MSSKFFNSELVQAELREIENLQEKVFRNFFNFNSLSKAGKLEQVDNLETLLNKQNIFYARLSLSDDPRAKEMKEQLQQQSRDLGFPDDVELGIVFKNMHRMIEQMKKTIDEQHGR